MDKRNQIVRNVNEKLENESYINNHKEALKDFSRDRVLTFVAVFMLILKKSIKSLQLALNELFVHGYIASIATSSAYTQARKKFKHTAFIELNNDTIEIYYSDNKIKRWHGYRCIGVDASVIILPNTKEIQNEFGVTKIKNQLMEANYCSAMFECFYDVLNRISIKSKLAHSSSYEASLASQMLDDTFKENDLLIFDRGYASYEFLSTLIMKGKNFLVRCPKNSFKAAQSLFENRGKWSKTSLLTVPSVQMKNIKEKGLPTKIRVRFVSVVLSTGEIEVLMTSLNDVSISRNDFKSLYNLRWGVEGFFNLIKGRLCLENFTGKTVEAIKQDFWSTIFITNIEAALTESIEEDINNNLNADQLSKKVNHAVSFNAIKNMAFEIFSNGGDLDKSLEKLSILFKTGAIVQRKDRSPPRKEINFRKSYNYLKRIKKQVF
jgi:hypothetical protein